MKEKGVDSISFISSGIKEGYTGKSLVQKSNLDEYLKEINSIKEKLEG